jgi:cephalosporin-C deacetylase-like acetyl esterase
MNELNLFDFYPSQEELSAWIDRLWAAEADLPATATRLNDRGERTRLGIHHMNRSSLYRFEQEGMRPFYGMWSPALKGPAPLIVHTPGYGAEPSFHPDVVGEGYNVLELSPLGYWTPSGDLHELKWFDGVNKIWPVLPQTALDPYSMESYFGWMLNVMGAIRWAMSQPTVIPDRVSFFGTSQGGGASLLLGSIYRDHGVRCVAADEPFLTNYPLSNFRGAYDHARPGVEKIDEDQFWHNIGFVDTLTHASRMTYPVLLTLGTKDASCPPECVQTLYDVLDTDKMLLSMKNRGHGYQYEFVRHTLTWFSLYA